MEMRYRVRIGRRDMEVLVRESEGRTSVAVDGREMQVELHEGAPGIYTLLVGGKPYDLAAVERPGRYSIAVEGVPFDAEVEDERQRRLTALGTPRSGMERKVEVRAPMPGLVTQIDAAEGDHVEFGQRLLVLEAMKMQNDLVAPRAGRVAQLLVGPGETVEQGQLLVTLA